MAQILPHDKRRVAREYMNLLLLVLPFLYTDVRLATASILSVFDIVVLGSVASIVREEFLDTFGVTIDVIVVLWD